MSNNKIAQGRRFGGRGSSGNSFGGPREMHPAVCSFCGKNTEVPFQVPVFCRECYRERESALKMRSDIGHTLEKMSALPEPQSLAITISSFANASGGTLMFGVDSTGEIIGLTDRTLLQSIVSKAFALISPPLAPKLFFFSRDQKEVAYLEIDASKMAPHYVGTQWYERFGVTTRIGWAPTLRAYSEATRANPNQSVSVQRLIAKVEQLSKSPMRAFISYSRSDGAFTRRLAADLNKRGVGVWLDEREIKVGDEIRTKIEHGIDTYDYFIIVLSQCSTASIWVEKELNAAFMKEVTQRRTVVLPAKIENCKIPPLISGKRFADFTTSYEQGLSSLLDVLAPS